MMESNLNIPIYNSTTLNNNRAPNNDHALSNNRAPEALMYLKPKQICNGEGNLIILTDQSEAQFLVQKEPIIFASKVLAQKIAVELGKTHYQFDGQAIYTQIVKLEAVDPEALEIFLLCVHLRKLSRTFSGRTLSALALLTEKYECYNAIQRYTADWFVEEKASLKETGDLMFAAYYFGINKSFQYYSHHLLHSFAPDVLDNQLLVDQSLSRVICCKLAVQRRIVCKNLSHAVMSGVLRISAKCGCFADATVSENASIWSRLSDLHDTVLEDTVRGLLEDIHRLSYKNEIHCQLHKGKKNPVVDIQNGREMALLLIRDAMYKANGLEICDVSEANCFRGYD